jgi:hypothetical protein
VTNPTQFIPGERRVGPHIKTQSIVFFILLFYFCTVLPQGVYANDVSLSVSMLQGEHQTRFTKPVLVAGIWHYMNITINQTIDELSLRLYKGAVLPTNKNDTNYYEWRYEKNSANVWNDVSGYPIQYIKQEACTKINNLYSFCIGIIDAMPNIVDYYENWTINVIADKTTLDTVGLVVEKPKTGVSLSKPSNINFYVDPFTMMDVQGDNFFKIGNIGNIPLYVDYDREKYSEIEFTDINHKFLSDEISPEYVLVHSKKWPPGIKKIDMQLNGSYPQSYFVDTNATVTLYSSFVIDVPELVIYVGHSNYRIDELQGTGITFQYLERLTMSEGEIRNINAYVSGNAAVTVAVSADGTNISLLKLYDNTTETHSPLSFLSTNTSERTITATIQALGEGKTGILTYTVTSSGTSKIYTTRITIGPPASTGEETTPNSGLLMQIIVVIVVLLVVIYMILSYVRKRTR